MIQIKYYDLFETEPRFNNPYATVYYKITAREKSKMQDHVDLVKEYITELHIQSAIDMNEPLDGFRRSKGKPNYTMYDIVTDLSKQLARSKDPTRAMLGRWNRIFMESELDIKMVDEREQDE